MERRKLSGEERLKILKEARESGVMETLNKHGVYPATYYSWKRKYEEMGEKGLQHSLTKDRLNEIRRLERELAALKGIVAEKDQTEKDQSAGRYFADVPNECSEHTLLSPELRALLLYGAVPVPPPYPIQLPLIFTYTLPGMSSPIAISKLVITYTEQ